MELVITRVYFPNGTNGVLSCNGEPVCNTIELPWKENQRQISCIPEGKYELRRRYTPRFGRHFELRHVVGRSNILIHAFNDAVAESKGCIAPVSRIIGEGKGVFSRISLARLTTLIYPALTDKPVFVTIKKQL